jgi:3-oxoacyl-[acyl-carrier protein] reductase
MEELKGKIALVTGVGRKEGIGAAVCLALAKQGADIFYTYWHQYDAEQFPETGSYNPADFVKELEALGVRAQSIELDLSKPDSPSALFKAVQDKFGTPHMLINNACYDKESSFAELTAESLDSHYAINVRAVTFLCQEFIRGWGTGQEGKIIILTSGQALGSMGGHKIPYTITKAAAEMLVKQLAPEFEQKGVTINAVNPGPTDTGWMSEEMKKQVLKDSTKGKINTPQDTAQFIVSLLTDKTKPTGQVMHAPW